MRLYSIAHDDITIITEFEASQSLLCIVKQKDGTGQDHQCPTQLNFHNKSTLLAVVAAVIVVAVVDIVAVVVVIFVFVVVAVLVVVVVVLVVL